MIAHIVLFNPRPGLSDAEQRSFARMLTEVAGEITSIRRARVGRSAKINAGYDRSFGDKTYEYAAVLEFDDEAGLLAYLRHERHLELGRKFWELCESTVIVEVDLKELSADLGDVFG